MSDGNLEDLDEQTLMIRDTVSKFVERELILLYQQVLEKQLAVDDGGVG